MNDSSVEPSRRGPGRMRLAFAVRGVCVGLLVLAGVAATAGSVNYTYDALGRLAKVIYNNGTTTTTINYSYDAAGNRSSVVTTSP
ncbi:YD repeat-containing protein [Variovorax boronicumulans]|uniref:YD repeat-containing protein n=1 Tax=Variovorax boronicumulans TaxID=436515 RepID=A0AAW8DQX0_9BURK|nr:RHS repeat domain-containing protein [Variovorax boronicumulans]MDP9877262.1 YD repeat-containing protein [Variovorax boronicumulans]MDP9921861.1 YD repeat-containing protein [Variovorax boronicumulans]